MILIESAEVIFGSGFNVISGETGAGKSAVMAALALVAGARSDVDLIRQHCKKAIVEATFHADDVHKIADLLIEAEIEVAQGESLLIRRELLASGRSRAFVNDQLVSLTSLKAIGARLIELVGQHANQELRQLESHRAVVDVFGHLAGDVAEFSAAWQQEGQLRAERATLTEQESQRIRDIETCQMQLEELHEANLQVGEEEELFAEYTLLNNSEELVNSSQSICAAIADDEGAVLTLLNREKNTLQRLVKLDPSLQDVADGFERARIELIEVQTALTQYLGRLDNRPERLSQVSDRLSLIHRLKRKYGSSIDEILTFQHKLEDGLERLQGADARLEQLEQLLAKAAERSDSLARELTKKRTLAATALSEALTEQLVTLNMPKVQLKIQITPQKRVSIGDDQVEILFAPNVGERLLSLKDCASGGELSRVMLALKAVMAGHAAVSTLIFDEIDANIGGATALIVGQKLAEIGHAMQLLCISHFPQVARFAQHHLEISKEERQGRTFTNVRVLEAADRERELRRMVGAIDEIGSLAVYQS